MISSAALDAFEACPLELQRAWAPCELRDYRLAAAARAANEPEPLPLAHACALELGVDAVLEEVGRDVLGAQRALWDWRLWARPTQLQPADADWSIWLILAGRGWGKTRTGVEWIRERVQSGDAVSIGLIGPSISDVWKTLVFGTVAAPGLARIFPPWERRVEVRRQDRQVVMHAPSCQRDGVECGCPVATLYTAEEPELRGPNLDTVLCDELAKWRYLDTIWDNLEMTLRSPGVRPPRICITTTPRPLPRILELLDDPDVRVTFGSTFANAANLHSKFLARMQRRYGGSRIGQQELFGLVLGDNPDALFKGAILEANRVEAAPELVRIVVAVDPAVSTNRKSDLTGIAVLGIDARGHVYVLADLTGVAFDRKQKGLVVWRSEEPLKHSPEEWGELVCRAVEHFEADAVVGERNRGGDLVASNVRMCWKEALRQGLVKAPAVKVSEVLATKNKTVRAEPVSTLYEQGRMHHIGLLPELETEMTQWNPKLLRPGESPNRLDAVVWGAYDLAGFTDEEKIPVDHAAIAEANRRILLRPAETSRPVPWMMHRRASVSRKSRIV